MVVVAIEQRDPHRRAGQRARGVEPAEAAADDDDVRTVGTASTCDLSPRTASTRSGDIEHVARRARHPQSHFAIRVTVDPWLHQDQLTYEAADRRSADRPSIVETACPLDCPDACSLAVTVQHGKVIAIDGSHKNPVTDGYICAKVRKFGERVYGPDRLLYPAVRKGRKGEGKFKRVVVGRSARADRRAHAAREGAMRAAHRSCRTRTAARTAC